MSTTASNPPVNPLARHFERFGGTALGRWAFSQAVVTRAEGQPHIPLDGHRQHKAVVVVGVLTDQIDPAGGPEEVSRRAAELLVEKLGGFLFERHR